MMIDKKGVDDVIDILSPDAFIKMLTNIFWGNRSVVYWNTASSIYWTVSAQLKKNAKLDLAGGDFYLIQLTKDILISTYRVSLQNYSSKKIQQRSLIRISSEITEESYDESGCFDLLIERNRSFEVTQGNIKRSSETAQSLVYCRKKNELKKLQDKKVWCITGFEKIKPPQVGSSVI
jgi:replicative DNA helicase